ncbi:MAG: exodeoxyribonuclease V subunit gamma [Raineya sp.]|jgi:DNA helicase-2/ATP-dependent DNA helicase PcrA|nr:exodeoxyribonuclease V subunit gamma [Raineya sp.]
MDYLEGLNEPQRQAVIFTDGPLMIIAGAGSGKTRVLTYRIAHLIYHGVDPYNILALTFTNKAANEMRERIEKVIGEDAKNIWMGTFHSIFAKILRIEGDKIGYTRDFSIYDTEDSKSLIKSIVKELNLDDKLYKASTVYSRISGAKNRLVSYREYNSNPIYRADDESYQRPEIGRIYQIYQERLFKANAMDFDDLLFNTNILFRDHLDVLNKYQHKFKYVMVDEFQDTNISQYLITRKLASVYQNIAVVGDDAQSIYAFRGADIQNILNFERDYPTLKTIRLEQNYRSTKTIVQAANSVIAKNQAQLKKNVWTSNESGDLIELVKATSDAEEGRMVAQSIFEDKMQFKYKNADFAILYRTNAQSRSFEEALRRMGIRYQVVGGLSFYQRREIKDLIAYLRFSINHNDEEAFKRIINLPKRGIGDATITKIVVIADEQKVAIWDVLSSSMKYIGGRAAIALDNFAMLIKTFEIAAKQKNAYDAALEIAKNSGLLKELYEDKSIEGLARYENVQELLNAIKEFVDNPENEDKTLGAFLQEVSLLTTLDEASEEGEDTKDAVTLMTIHSAKGLEFKNVFVVGMEEDLFPSQMMIGSRSELEEERRLFYVAITRAEKKLTLSYASSRYRFGRIKDCEPSRFLDEIDPRCIKQKNASLKSSFGVGEELGLKNLIKNNNNTTQQTVVKKPAYKPSPDFKASDTTYLAAGMKVEHLKFGYGLVLEVQGEDKDRKARINFEEAGEKLLLLSFAKLKVHD